MVEEGKPLASIGKYGDADREKVWNLDGIIKTCKR